MAAAAAASALPSLSAAGKAAATAGVAGGIWGKFAWGYNRSLYMYDAGFRFDRFCAGYDFANAQQEMFRNDLLMMTELTFRKMGIYTVLGTMGMAIYIAIFCAGRLGLHGPSPPIWIMGLFLTNIAFSFATAGMGIWLAFHAMWRCKAACLHLNTRKVRLMIPTRKKLDDARKYGNQWEHQKFRDMARLPYISDAVGQKWSGEVMDASDDENERPHSAPPAPGRRVGNGMKRAPNWIAEEYEQERVGIAGGSGNSGQPANAAPEHFKLYANAQKEWFTHDCYARICMFYSFLSFFQGGAFYGMTQIIVETRAWWPAFALSFIFTVIHILMLRFDIVKNVNSNQKERLPMCQYCGSAVIPLACIGMALDFRVEYWDVAIQFTWLMIFVCYILQILYTFRLLELVVPNEIKRDDEMGGNWWPIGWKVPSSFQHVYYFVAPPPRLAVEKGQFDVVRELKEGYYRPNGGNDPRTSSKDDHILGLEDYFQWMMRAAFPNMSKASQDQVRTLYQRFQDAPNRHQGTELANVLGHIEAELRGIEKQDAGFAPGDAGKGGSNGYDSGSGSGSGSEGSSGYSSSGSGKSEYTKEYPPNAATPRYHPAPLTSLRFSYAEPHRLVMVLTTTFACSYVFLTFGMLVDRFLGVQALVTAPHWAKPPMTRSSKFPWERGTPLGLQPYMINRIPIPEELYWHENLSPKPKGWKPHWMSTGHDRRLSASSSSSWTSGLGQEGMKQAFGSLVSALPKTELAKELLHRVPTQAEAAALTSLESRFRPTGYGWHPQEFTWPTFFEPKLLACAPSQDGARHALAITPRGIAASAQFGVDGGQVERFVLTGLSNYPPLLSASYSRGHNEGLMLVTKKGHLLHCPGARTGSQWACDALANAPPRVPQQEGTALFAAASAWLGGTSEHRLHAAVISESSPDVVVMWVLDGNTEAASWFPLGELPVPQGMAIGASLTFVNDGELLLATRDGATIQRRISDGTVVTSTPALELTAESQPEVHWQAACGLHDGGVAHLAMRHEAGSRRPEVMVLRSVNSAV